MLNNLFKRTALQQSFAGNMMAVLGGGRMPEQLTLRRALLEFIEFRVECVQRRTAFELKKAETRLHLVEGLLVALARLDEVVDAIRQARTSLALALAPALAPALALQVGEGSGLFGAKITGGGSGGSVCVVGEAGAKAEASLPVSPRISMRLCLCAFLCADVDAYCRCPPSLSRRRGRGRGKRHLWISLSFNSV